jgi:uncharacterized protein (DUF433 family)
MPAENLLTRISVDPNVCFGKPRIRGTRIWVSLILGNLAEGVSESELLASFPQLSWKTSEPPSLTARLPRRRRGEMERSETRHGD